MKRVAVLFDNFGPYHYARLNAAGKFLDVLGLETSATSADYAWKAEDAAKTFRRVTLRADGSKQPLSPTALRSAVGEALNDFAPDAVAIPGWSHKAALSALLWCIEAKKPAILMSESTSHDEVRRWWKEAMKRRIVRACAAGFVGGSAHVRYLMALGMPQAKIQRGYDAVDNEYFAHASCAARENAEEVRTRLALPEHYFLASCRFIPKKNLLTLIAAYAIYRQGAGSAAWKLVIIGDGPERSVMEDAMRKLGLGQDVSLPGFQQYETLPSYYALAGAFVHASRSEQWGLVVNEAMACGLPVIVSDRCGCAEDLLADGVNGFTFDPNDERQLASQLKKMAALPPKERDAMGETSYRTIAAYAPEFFGRGLAEAVKASVPPPPRGDTLWIIRSMLSR